MKAIIKSLSISSPAVLTTVASNKFVMPKTTISDWLGLLKSIIWEKLFWEPEIPNENTHRSLEEAKAELGNPEFWSPGFTNSQDAIAWLKSSKIK